jgi:hypothetical protein
MPQTHKLASMKKILIRETDPAKNSMIYYKKEKSRHTTREYGRNKPGGDYRNEIRIG